MSADASPASPETSAPEPAAAQQNPAQDRSDVEPDRKGTDRKDSGRASGAKDIAKDISDKALLDGADSDAYDRGYRTYRPVVKGGKDQQVHIGDHYYFAGHVPVPPSGPVRSEVLDTIRARYVEVSVYPEMAAALSERRFLMLSGPSATGRSTTALYLLDEQTKGDVSRLDAAADLRAISEEDLQRGRGYLGELTENSPPLSVSQADRLADLLERHDRFLIVVVTPDHVGNEAFLGYGLECPPPDADELLAQHIRTLLDPADPGDLRKSLAVLAASPELRAALGPRPSVAETAKLARLLVAHGHNELTLQEVEAECGDFVTRQVMEWFGALPRVVHGVAAERAMRLAAFQLALAVFDEMPRNIVAQASEDLATRLIRTVHPRRAPGRPLFADLNAGLLASVRAEALEREVRYSSGAVPARVLHFQDDRYPQAVLNHVWQQHHNMRPPLISWLRNLVRDPRRFVRTCAAQATGVLCWVDFPGTFHDLIRPVARTEPPEDPSASELELWWGQLQFAAVALDKAFQDDRLRTVVKGILQEWRRQGNHAERCTAAIALGYELGHQSVEESLDELRIIGTPQELDAWLPLDKTATEPHGDLIWAAGEAIARLFATGARYPVLARLTHWIERKEHPERYGRPQRQSLQLLALQTVVLMAGTKAGSLSERQFAGTRPGEGSFPQRFEERLRWPLLLALLDDDPSLGGRFAYLLRRALRSAAGEIV